MYDVQLRRAASSGGEGEEKMPLEFRQTNPILCPMAPFHLAIHIRVKSGGSRAHRGSGGNGIGYGERHHGGKRLLLDLSEHQKD